MQTFPNVQTLGDKFLFELLPTLIKSLAGRSWDERSLYLSALDGRGNEGF
jgi:hypothetical protein